MHTLVLLLWGLAAGAAHAFEIDHMTAVSTFVAKRPTPAKAVLFGIKWALGHGLSLLLLGSLLFALKATLDITMSETLAGSLERVVGMALFGLGLWTLLRLGPSQLPSVAAHSHAHSHDGTHTHSHEAARNGEIEDGHSHPHAHDHGSLWMGVLHGLAGTAGFVGEGVVALSQSYSFVVAYTLVFSLGVLIAMGFYAAILGGAISWGGRRSHSFLGFARGLSGICACVVGLMWMLNWKPFAH